MTTYKALVTETIKDSLIAKIEKLNKKLIKHNEAPITYTATEEKIICESSDFERSFFKMYNVEVTGKVLSIDGYTFVAKVEREHSEETVNKVVDIEIPEEKIKSRMCDHCNTNRKRKTTYIIQNQETNELMSVGSTCLKDFFPSQSVAYIVAYFEFISNYPQDEPEKEFDDHGYSGCRACKEISLVHYLAHVLSFARFESFNKETHEGATNDMWLKAPQKIVSWEEVNTLLPEVQEMIDEAANYEGSNEFLNKLRIFAKDGWVVFKELKAAAWIVGNALKQAQKASEINLDEYYGEVKKRYTLSLKCIFKHCYETMYGWSCIYKMKDEEGRTFVWFGSNCEAMNVDESVVCKATVKDHQEYEGKKQTIVTRLKVQ